MKNKVYALRNLVWIGLLLIAVCAIVYGCAPQFDRAEWELVLIRAANICFQCIGLG